jgi:hypothetical protein
VSCKTQEWKKDVFHGSPGGQYRFDTIDGHASVIFEDYDNEAIFVLINGQIESK